jgi:hypothetical protein
MQPGDIKPCGMRGDEFGQDLVEVERRRVDLASTQRAVVEEFHRHQRTGVQADG